ncbi:SURF1 family cytochrome oxidase biogenesis protein [Rehaibacterium terrae]|uniref:SURF1-like protein n=1 Tax=Rehaibacterium terrae TaxID=1341696 RepID=A0A7W7XXW1_9GAMM|nr:cytochrome oxidase assembly protein ShyY1 [Rehaibacterium terrae]
MSRILLWVLALAVCLLFVALGRWQWARALEKEALLAAQAQALAEPVPLPLARALADGDGGLRWVEGEGVFVDAPAILLDNQQRGGRVGVKAYRLFRPLDGDHEVLVDLGWLPLPPDRALPAIARPEGVQRVRGLLAPPPAIGLRLATAGVQADGTRLLLYLDTTELANELQRPLATRVLRLDPALPLGYARDLDLLPNTLPPEKHRGYALQWWGLAAAVAVIALLLGVRRRKA